MTTSKKVQAFLNKYKNDVVVKAWIDNVQKKPEKYRDRDLEFLAVTLDFMEKLAKALVLTEVNQMGKLMELKQIDEEMNDFMNKLIVTLKPFIPQNRLEALRELEIKRRELKNKMSSNG